MSNRGWSVNRQGGLLHKNRSSRNGCQELGVTSVRINDRRVKNGQPPVVATVKCAQNWQNGGPLGVLGPFYWPLYMDIPTKSSQFGLLRPTRLDSNSNSWKISFSLLSASAFEPPSLFAGGQLLMVHTRLAGYQPGAVFTAGRNFTRSLLRDPEVQGCPDTWSG